MAIIHLNTKKLIWISGIFGLLVAVFGYWLYSQRYVSTDDAYINADIIQIAAQVTGPIIRLPIVNNQLVKKDQLLFDIDPAPFQTAVDAANANVALAQAKLADTKITTERTLKLVKEKTLPSQAGDDAVANLASAEASLRLAQANLTQATLNLNHTHITAPATGYITNMTVREGTVVTADQPLFALISNAYYWIDANFKETDLDFIRPGQTATISVDIYPEYRFKGVVESISGGSGAEFSLLPPQNATGNWVKVAQRVPVRVRILNPPQDKPLRLGTSATVTVDLRSK